VVLVRSPTELSEHFRANGLKVTPQRELVFRILHRNAAHPTAEAVFATARETMPMISLKTVYQVLHDLRGLGEIQALEVGTGATRFDPNVGDHHHLVCSRCGAVHDITIDTTDLVLGRAQRHGFAVDQVEVTFRGLCASCRTLPKHT
jgi:Fe2+ or Zn2+ uptake regulation protein